MCGGRGIPTLKSINLINLVVHNYFKDTIMTLENFNKAMAYLDVIEIELDIIAKAFGHVSFSEFDG